jgi:hypothetical protein
MSMTRAFPKFLSDLESTDYRLYTVEKMWIKQHLAWMFLQLPTVLQ